MDGWLDSGKKVSLFVMTGIAVLVMAAQCGTGDDTKSDADSKPTTSKPQEPYPHQTMPGDGWHLMGGVDGKDFGLWEASGSTTPCKWSIRATHPYSAAQILREGESAPGQRAQANIVPFARPSSITGEIDDYRVGFQTNGCGSWKWIRGY